MLADGKGDIVAGTAISDVVVPVNSQAPAKATTEIGFARNLDSDSSAKGTVTYSKPWYAAAKGDVLLSGLHNSTGKDLGIQSADVLTISAKDSSGTTVTRKYTVKEGDSLKDLASEIQSFLRTDFGNLMASVSVEDGALSVSPGGVVDKFEISTNRPTSNALVTDAFHLPTSFDSASSTARLLMGARPDTLLADVVDNAGYKLGLENGDQIDISAAVGGKVNGATRVSYDPSSTKMKDILNALQNQLRLPDLDGTPQNQPSVELNQADGNPNIPDGAIVLRGQTGEAFSLTNISIVANNSNSTSPSPTYFNGNSTFTQTQQAKDAGIVNTSIVAYDDKGFEHTIGVTFTPSSEPNEWLWQATTPGNEKILSGQKGHVLFGPDGTVSSFTFDDSAGALRIDPQDGASLMEIKLNPGGPGMFQGLTQYRASSTAAAAKQDGYTMGVLQNISIGSDGTISGNFTNGVNRVLAQIMVADFTNPGGLSKESESVYGVSSNSGDPIFGKPGKQSTTQIKSGTLEMSNVDLAKEFTSMIITQRGFQANSKVISTSDQLLQELVGLVR
jgi:flagellar hook protein FlgE